MSRNVADRNAQGSAIVGLDIGGAHLKAAWLDSVTGGLKAGQWPSPLWRGLEHLDDALAAAWQHFSGVIRLAVTMSGEGADIFPDRAGGVCAIVDSCMRFAARRGIAEVCFYGGKRGWLSAQQARKESASVASANWRLAADCAALHLSDGNRDYGLLLDTGTTTTDIIPLRRGRAVAVGGDDFERLGSGELVYSGIVRTPVIAIANAVPIRRRLMPLSAEIFATTADVYRVLGLLPERCDQLPAADGGDKTAAGSRRRLARMLGSDDHVSLHADIGAFADFLAARQFRIIERAARRVLARMATSASAHLTIIGAGCGRFLARKLAASWQQAPPSVLASCVFLDFARLLSGGGFSFLADDEEEVARCAPAVAALALYGGGGMSARSVVLRKAGGFKGGLVPP